MLDGQAAGESAISCFLQSRVVLRVCILHGWVGNQAGLWQTAPLPLPAGEPSMPPQLLLSAAACSPRALQIARGCTGKPDSLLASFRTLGHSLAELPPIATSTARLVLHIKPRSAIRLSMAELPCRGARSARRPRVNYLQLLASAGLTDDPDTPPAGGQQRRTVGGSSGGAPPPPLAQRPRPAAADENAGLEEQGARPAKRQRGAKATAQAVLVAAAAEDAELAAVLGEAGADGSSSDDDQPRPAKPRQRRQRVLVDVHGGPGAGSGSLASGGSAAAGLEQVDNEYERQVRAWVGN